MNTKFTYNKKLGGLVTKESLVNSCGKNENLVRIKITKPRAHKWYEYKVGEEFDAIESQTLFRVKLSFGTAGLVEKENAEIIKFL